jgi:7-cyano-7-deazaguanine synthase in queuosine biosynthesis
MNYHDEKCPCCNLKEEENKQETQVTPNQNQETKKPIALIQLSGGIDSTFVLYDWLINNPDENILVHHINLINHENRCENEKLAVQRIIKWLSEKGHNNFTYIESTFDYGNIGSIIKDVEICNFFIGIILRSSKWTSVKKVYMPIYRHEKVETLRQKRANRLRKLVSNDSILNEKLGIEVIYPIEHNTKREVIDKMPEGLLELCWYCRYGGIMPCGECITCMDIKKSYMNL